MGRLMDSAPICQACRRVQTRPSPKRRRAQAQAVARVSNTMSDYDDLYKGSLTFDEDMEASLQRVELEFFAIQQPRPASAVPPFKKLKTEHDWASSSNSTHVPQNSQKSQGWRQALRAQEKDLVAHQAVGSSQGRGSNPSSSSFLSTFTPKPQYPPLSQRQSSTGSSVASQTRPSNLRRVSSRTDGDLSSVFLICSIA